MLNCNVILIRQNFYYFQISGTIDNWYAIVLLLYITILELGAVKFACRLKYEAKEAIATQLVVFPIPIIVFALRAIKCFPAKILGC